MSAAGKKVATVQKSAAIKAELDRLNANGVIRPVDVVEAARSKRSVLHGCFTWEDTEAAHQYRLIEARNLLRVYVLTEKVDGLNVRAFVSLTSDRVKDGGGYRAITDVMSDAELREQMLADAVVRLRNVQLQYKSLRQLDRVWDALDEVEDKAPKPKSRKTRAA